MKTICLVFSLFIHVILVYFFTTLDLSHGYQKYGNKTTVEKEIITVRPIKLVFPPGNKVKEIKKNELPVIIATSSTSLNNGSSGEQTVPGQKPADAAKENENVNDTGNENETGNYRDPGSGSREPSDTGQGEGNTRDLDPGTAGPGSSGAFSFNLEAGEIRSIIRRTDRQERARNSANTAVRASFIRGCNMRPWSLRAIHRIKSNWVIPPAVKIGAGGIVGISVVVEKNGRLSTIRITTSSHVAALDDAAANAFSLSNPLPALPDDFPYANLNAYFLFNYNVPSGSISVPTKTGTSTPDAAAPPQKSQPGTNSK